MQPTPPPDRLPTEPQDCRKWAEDLARTHGDPEAPGRAVAWALLAIAGELRELRRAIDRRR